MRTTATFYSVNTLRMPPIYVCSTFTLHKLLFVCYCTTCMYYYTAVGCSNAALYNNTMGPESLKCERCNNVNKACLFHGFNFCRLTMKVTKIGPLNNFLYTVMLGNHIQSLFQEDMMDPSITIVYQSSSAVIHRGCGLRHSPVHQG